MAVNFLLNPSAFGYPDATNTGIAGAGNPSLVAVSGKLEIMDARIDVNDTPVLTRPASGSATWGPITAYPDRTEIDLMDLTGRVQVKTSLSLAINRSRMVTVDVVSASRLFELHESLGGAVTLTDCTLDANQHSAAIYGWGSPITVLRCNVQGGEDVMWLQGGGPIRVTDSYLHTPTRPDPAAHADLFQTGGVTDAIVSHCTLKAAVPTAAGAPNSIEFPDGWYDPMNAIIMASNFGGAVGSAAVQGIVMDDCLVDGGNYSFADNWSDPTFAVHGITVSNCRIGRHFRFGVWSVSDAPTDPAPPTWTTTNNVWDDTSEAEGDPPPPPPPPPASPATLAHDTFTNFAQGVGNTPNPMVINHVPASTPRGVLVIIGQWNGATDRVTGVTYGGVPMTRVAAAFDISGELIASYMYFLGSGIPAGTQEVAVSHNGIGSGGSIGGGVVSVTAGGDTEVGDFGILQADQANPQIALDTVETAIRYAAFNSGHDLNASHTPVANTTGLVGAGFDLGGESGDWIVQTTPSAGSFTIGWTATSEDVAMVAVAIQEVAVEPEPEPGAARLCKIASLGMDGIW